MGERGRQWGEEIGKQGKRKSGERGRGLEEGKAMEGGGRWGKVRNGRVDSHNHIHLPISFLSLSISILHPFATLSRSSAFLSPSVSLPSVVNYCT